MFIRDRQHSLIRRLLPIQSQSTSTTPSSPSAHDLNNLLPLLIEIYPEHDVSLCREALLTASHSGQSGLLEAAADILADAPADRQRRAPGQIQPWEYFRTEGYKEAVTKTLHLEFHQVRSSDFQATLAENNWDYVRSRDCLSKLHRSWRATFASLLEHRTRTANSTGCPELDQEIRAAQDQEQHALHQKQHLAVDNILAAGSSDEAATTLFECQCCFNEHPWKDMCWCPEKHYFCRHCFQRSVESSLYDQAAGIDYMHDSMRCISSVASPPCTEAVSLSLLPQFLTPKLLAALEDHLAKYALDQSGLSSLRCPFCRYAIIDRDEIDDVQELSAEVQRLHRELDELDALSQSLSLIRRSSHDLTTWDLSGIYNDPVLNEGSPTRSHQRPEWESIFRCQNPQCRRSSCLKCGKEWLGMHNCRKDGIVEKNVFIAKMKDEALKRTCPKCGTSFIKNGGCNKMTCPCGFHMCYLCRAELGGNPYAHFCNHFREVPNTPCKECTHCNLYEEEAVDVVLRVAQIQAEREWQKNHHTESDDMSYIKDRSDVRWPVGMGRDGIIKL